MRNSTTSRREYGPLGIGAGSAASAAAASSRGPRRCLTHSYRMGTISLDYLKQGFASLVQRADPAILAPFILWLDLKVAEYKVNGFMLMGTCQHSLVQTIFLRMIGEVVLWQSCDKCEKKLHWCYIYGSRSVGQHPVPHYRPNLSQLGSAYGLPNHTSATRCLYETGANKLQLLTRHTFL